MSETIPDLSSKDAYGLLCKAERDADPSWRNEAAAHWVMSLEWYKAIRRAFLSPDLPSDDEARDESKWIPDNGDMVLFRYIRVTDDGGAPHLEKAR